MHVVYRIRHKVEDTPNDLCLKHVVGGKEGTYSPIHRSASGNNIAHSVETGCGFHQTY